MRILIIAPSAYLLGGVQDWLYQTTLGLRERGYKLIVGVPDGCYHNAKLYNSHYRGLDALFFKNKTGTQEGRIRALQSFIKEIETDIIMGVNIGDLYEALLRTYDRYDKTRFVMSLHAIEANYFADVQTFKDILDAVITTNRLTQNLVADFGGMELERTYYAPYGVKIRNSFKQKDMNKELGLLWVGRLENTQKRVFDLPMLLKSLDRLGVLYKLSIAGEGPDGPKLKVELQEWVHQGKVMFCGTLNKDELQALYRSNHVLLITSEWETGPIVAWEGIDAGLVVVSSRYTGLKAEGTLVNRETALLYNIGDTENAAIQIQSLVNSSFRLHLSTKAINVVNERYSLTASLNAWENVFLQIMEQPVKKRIPTDVLSWREPNGKLERYLGRNLTENVRMLFPARKPADPGCEWPHSTQGIIDQKNLLKYAREIEEKP